MIVLLSLAPFVLNPARASTTQPFCPSGNAPLSSTDDPFLQVFFGVEAGGLLKRHRHDKLVENRRILQEALWRN
jgi:hypothetical protein